MPTRSDGSGPNPLSVTRLREDALAFPAALPANQCLDVWLLSTQMIPEERESHWSTLSRDEQDRAGRFLMDADRNRFIAARGGLRVILSSYCGVRAADLVFQTGSYGKPFLVWPDTPLEFNVSHSGDCVLVGVTQDAPCGVDIECSRPGRPEIKIAERFFCARELRWLKQAEGGFLVLWTAKEAILKAVGRGLSIPLSAVDVTDAVSGTISSVELETDGIKRRSIWVTTLVTVEGYAAAAAVDGYPHEIRIVADRRR